MIEFKRCQGAVKEAFSKFERCRQEVAEAETSCATRQSTVFEFMDPKEYDESMVNRVGHYWDGARMVPYANCDLDYRLCERPPLGGRIIP